MGGCGFGDPLLADEVSTIVLGNDGGEMGSLVMHWMNRQILDRA